MSLKVLGQKCMTSCVWVPRSAPDTLASTVAVRAVMAVPWINQLVDLSANVPQKLVSELHKGVACCSRISDKRSA